METEGSQTILHIELSFLPSPPYPCFFFCLLPGPCPLGFLSPVSSLQSTVLCPCPLLYAVPVVYPCSLSLYVPSCLLSPVSVPFSPPCSGPCPCLHFSVPPCFFPLFLLLSQLSPFHCPRPMSLSPLSPVPCHMFLSLSLLSLVLSRPHVPAQTHVPYHRACTCLFPLSPSPVPHFISPLYYLATYSSLHAIMPIFNCHF